MVNIGFLTYNDDSIYEKTKHLPSPLGERSSDYANITVPNKREYCQKHNYIFYNYNSIQEDWSPEWSKVIYCLKHLKEHDWIFWSDADAMITNFNFKIENIIDENFDIIVSNDIGGMNTGSFLIKNSEWSFNFLKQLYILRELFEKGISFSSNQRNQFTDQDAMVYLFKNNWENTQQHFKFINKRIFNSYAMTSVDDWQIGDFILHMPGTANRKEKFEKFISLIVK